MTIEELQIIISAKTEQVQSKIAAVKEKIAGLQPKKAADVDVTTNKAQGNLKRLQAEIDRTQAKIQKLAEKQNAVQSEIEARAGMYSAVPNLAGMGHEETVGTLMDRDPKIQQLTEQMSALDAQTAPLKTHLSEARAQIAAAGNAAEPAAAKTRRLGESMQTAGNRIQGAGRSSGYFGRMVKSMLLSMALYSGVSFLMKSISEGMQNMALGNAQANSTMSQLATSALYLENSIAAALMPALQALTPIIVQVADAISWAANQIAIFIAQVTGQKTVTIATKSYVDYAKSLNKAGDSASNASKKVKELQRTIMGFDELNVLQKNVEAAGGGSTTNTPDYDSMFKTIPTPPSNWDLSSLQKNIQKVFDRLKDSADKGGKALDKVKDKAKELEKELEKVKLPVLGNWKIPTVPKIPEFPPVPAPQIEDWKVPDLPKIPDFPPVKAPIIPPIKVPEWNFGAYDKSKQKYQQPVMAPAVLVAIAPAIILNAFLASRAEYQKTITSPTIQRPTAPAIDLSSNFTPSLSLGLANLRAWSANALIALDKWGKNTRTNFKTTFDNVILTVDTALNGVSKNSSKWIGATSGAFALFGMNVAKNIQKAFSNVYSNVMKTLDKMWNRYSALMSIMGETISIGWNTGNVGMVLGGVVLAGITVAPLILGGALVGAANGAFVTGPSLLEVGEGKDSEAILPLNQNVFTSIAKGIQENGGGDSFSEMVGILRSIDESLKQGHNISMRMEVDGRPFVDKVIKEIDNRDRRYHAVKQY